MNKRIRIEVTAADIKKGVPGNTCRCPIALACKRAGLEDPEVDGGLVMTLAGDFLSPKRAERFIINFDKDGPKAVKPFVFHLTPAQL